MRYVTPDFIPQDIGSTAILGVWLNEDEEIEWHYHIFNKQYFVTGYTISKNSDWWYKFNKLYPLKDQ